MTATCFHRVKYVQVSHNGTKTKAEHFHKFHKSLLKVGFFCHFLTFETAGTNKSAWSRCGVTEQTTAGDTTSQNRKQVKRIFL